MISKSPIPSEEFSEADLALYLQSRTFVDYLNVYLNLPVFAQRLIYKFDERDFEFDPPIAKSKCLVDKKKLIEWLMKERIPGFLKTDLYHECTLSSELTATKQYLCDSAHRVDYEQHKHAEDESLLQECVGSVIGMRRFRHYIEGTPGEKLLNFWLDAEKFCNIPKNETGLRWRLFREIQIVYFKRYLFQASKAIDRGSFNILTADESLLQDSNFNLNILNEPLTEIDLDKICLTEDTLQTDNKLVQVMAATDFSQIQYLVLTVLQEYWVPKYVLHCAHLKSKVPEKNDSESTYRLKTESDFKMLKDTKEIDKALLFLQETPKPNVMRARKARLSWRAMFPEKTVNKSFLEEGGDIVTLHDDGLISVDPIDADVLDAMLERYSVSEDSNDTVSEKTLDDDKSIRCNKNISSQSLAKSMTISGLESSESSTAKQSKDKPVKTTRAVKTEKVPPGKSLHTNSACCLESTCDSAASTDSDKTSHQFDLSAVLQQRAESTSSDGTRPLTPTPASNPPSGLSSRAECFGQSTPKQSRHRSTPKVTHDTSNEHNATPKPSVTQVSDEAALIEKSQHARKSSVDVQHRASESDVFVPPCSKVPDKSQSPLQKQTNSTALIDKILGAIKRQQEKVNPLATDEPVISRSPSSATGICTKKSKETHQNPNKPSPSTILMFQQLLQLNYDPWQDVKPYEERPPRCPIKAVHTQTTSNASKLPAIQKSKPELSKKLALASFKLPAISDSQLTAHNIAASLEPQNVRAEISSLNYHYRNICDGYFRYDYNLLVLSTALDLYAGEPFRKYLKQNEHEKALYALSFWNDVQMYLNAKSDTEEIKRQLQRRRSKMLITKYISMESKYILPLELVKLLHKMLLENKGDDLLREAQDFVCKSFRCAWRACMEKDLLSFDKTCLVTRLKIFQGKSKTYQRFSGKMRPPTPIKYLENDQGDNTETRNVIHYDQATQTRKMPYNEMYPETTYVQAPRKNNALTLTTQRRMLLAAQLTLDASKMLDENLPIEPLHMAELVLDLSDANASLALKPLVRIQRRDLFEQQERQKAFKKEQARLKIKRLRISEMEKAPVKVKASDHLLSYMKSFKRNGVWQERQMPRNFNDMLRDDIQREYFRRYLAFHNAEIPLVFHGAVNDVKRLTDVKAKQKKIRSITKTYFPYATYAVDVLKTTAEIISEIPNQDRVTQAMLVSAQTMVAKSMHDNWYDEHLKTFPEFDTSQPASVFDIVTQVEVEEVKPHWELSHTSRGWKRIIRALVNFHRTIMDRTRSISFSDWLMLEAKKEVKMQKSSNPNYSLGAPVKRIIKSKVVDVNKLSNDMFFVGEIYRYTEMCSYSAKLLEDGIYYIQDEKLIEEKAHTIVQCFLDSPILPKIQINAPQDQIDGTIKKFEDAMFERNLFFKLAMTVVPVVMHLWRKYQTHIVTNARTLSELGKEKAVSTYKGPNYFESKLPLPHIRVNEEEIPHIFFSFVTGMKVVLPNEAEELKQPSKMPSHTSKECSSNDERRTQPTVKIGQIIIPRRKTRHHISHSHVDVDPKNKQQTNISHSHVTLNRANSNTAVKISRASAGLPSQRMTRLQPHVDLRRVRKAITPPEVTKPAAKKGDKCKASAKASIKAESESNSSSGSTGMNSVAVLLALLRD